MFTCSRSWGRRRLERGGVALIVAVFLAGGVLIGASAIAIDVGNLMFERRQLQNGADAAAWKLAGLCDKDKSNCSQNNATTLTSLRSSLSANASDNAAQLDDPTWAPKGICGHVKGVSTTNLPACPSQTTTQDINNLNVCQPLPDWLAAHLDVLNYVEVYGLTKTPNNGSVVRSFFNAGPGTSVGSCSRVAWGPAKPLSQLPLTFGQCEWVRAVGATLDPNPDYPGKVSYPMYIINTTNVVYGKEIALALNYKNKNVDCASWQGHDYPGGFGWLDHPTGVCNITPDLNSWVPGWPGNGTGNDCLPSVHPGDIIYVPIYDCINDNKNYCPNEKLLNAKTNYHILGMAQFQVTAIDLTGKAEGTPGSAAQTMCNQLTNNGQCIYGRFTQDLVPTGEFDFDPSHTGYGVSKAAFAG